MSLYVDLLVAMLRDGRMGAVMDAGVTDEMLFDEGRLGFIEAQSLFRQYGKMPTLSTIADRCPLLREALFKYEGEGARPIEPLQYYLDEVKLRHRNKILAESLTDLNTVAQRADPDATEQALMQALAKSRSISRARGKTLLRMADTVDALKAAYEKAAETTDGVTGYRSPWPSLDALTTGYHPGELWILVARPNTGKTMALLLHAVAFRNQGIRVLVITLEMLRQAIMSRYVSLRGKIPMLDVRRGRLTENYRERYYQQLEELRADDGLMFAGDGLTTSVDELEALIVESNADAVLIDGLYKYDPATADGKNNERVARIVNRLAMTCLLTGKFIMGTTQLSREDAVAFTDAIQQDAHGILKMKQNKDQKRNKRMEWMDLKVREGPRGWHKLTHWDFDIMNFDEATDATPSGGGSSAEETPVVMDPSQPPGGQATLVNF